MSSLDELEADINESTNIYDILAAANIALGAYSPEIKARYKRENYGELCNHVASFEYDGLPFDNFKEKVVEWLSALKFASPDIDPVDAYALIKCIDSIHSYKVTAPSGCAEEDLITIKQIPALNSRHIEELQILPRLKNHGSKTLTLSEEMNLACKKQDKDKKGFRKRFPRESLFINSSLVNFDIFTKSVGTPSVVVHRFSNEASTRLSTRLGDKGKCLTIGLFPLWGGNFNKTWRVNYTDTTFTVTGMEENAEERMLNRFKAALDRCKEKNVDIAVFPEMTMTWKNLDEIKEHIKRIPEDKRPLFVVLGTIWENGAKDGTGYNQNVCIVMSQRGEILFKQQKLSSFRFGEEKLSFEEELSFNDRTLHVIDIEEVGRFCISICSDVISPTPIGLLKGLCADVVLVPAFSPSRELKSELESLAKGFWTTAILCNCCSALAMDDISDEDCWIPKEILEKQIKFLVKHHNFHKRFCRLASQRLAKWRFLAKAIARLKFRNSSIIRKGLTEEDKRRVWELGFIMTPAKDGASPAADINALGVSGSCINCQSVDMCLGGIFDVHYTNYLPPSPAKHGRIDVKQRT